MFAGVVWTRLRCPCGLTKEGNMKKTVAWAIVNKDTDKIDTLNLHQDNGGLVLSTVEVWNTRRDARERLKSFENKADYHVIKVAIAEAG